MIFAYTEKNEAGNHVDENGERYILYTASRIHGTPRKEWKEFENVAAAVEYFGLSPYIDPNAEIEQQTIDL